VQIVDEDQKSIVPSSFNNSQSLINKDYKEDSSEELEELLNLI